MIEAMSLLFNVRTMEEEREEEAKRDNSISFKLMAFLLVQLSLSFLHD